MSFRAKVFSKTFTGAGTVRFPGGKFFRLITATVAVDLTFYTPAGMVIATVSGVLAGFRLRADDLGIEGFGSVDVTVTGAQTVAAIISSVDIDYDRSAGSVDINNEPTIALVRAVLPRSVSVAWFRRAVNLSALQTIVTPAANTAGIIVHSAGASVRDDGDAMRVMWKSTAPASIDDTTAGTLAYAEAQSALPMRIVHTGGQFPTRLPAGVGLYVQQLTAVVTTCAAWVDYEVQT